MATKKLTPAERHITRAELRVEMTILAKAFSLSLQEMERRLRDEFGPCPIAPATAEGNPAAPSTAEGGE